ncbi:MAG: EpsG family protein [Clostridia bacterium]|nr:EpsG family protein [Clostridia bacterium]
MIPYVLVVLVPLIFDIFYVEKPALTPDNVKYNNRRRFRWLLLASLPMFILIAFRAPVIGPDTGVYNLNFIEMVQKSWDDIDFNTRMEQGYLIFTKLITYITQDVLVFQIIYTAIYWIIISDFANQLEKGNFFFLFIYATIGLYLFMFTGVRQCLAMCICLLSYRFIKKRKLIPFVILILLAVSFHKSAILFLAAYILYAIRFNILTIFGYIVAAVIAYFNIGSIQEWFNNQLDYDYELQFAGNGYVAIIIMFCVTAFSTFAVLNQPHRSKDVDGLLNIGIITMMFWFLRLATRTAERPSFYFMFFLAAIFTDSIEQTRTQREHSIVKTILVLLFLLYFIYRVTHVSSLTPYRFY